MDKNNDIITFISKYLLILRRPREAIFAAIIKIVTMFVKTNFEDSKKVKRIRNYVSKGNLYPYFLIWQNLLISGEKMLISAEIRGVSRDSKNICYLL